MSHAARVRGRFTPQPLDLAAVLALLLLTLAAFWPILIGARVLYFGDLTLYFEPLLAFQRAELHQGRIPLWNPNILCGTPFVGNPQAWPLYPSSLLLYLFPAAQAMGVMAVSHLFLAALGTYAFLRARRRGRFAALFAAIVWGFGGALVSKAQFPNMVQAAAYLPWLLWGLERLRDRPNAGRMAVLALLVGLSIFAAHPQMTLMQGYLAVAWTLWRLSGLAKNEKVRFLGAAAGAATLGGMLAAAQLLPVAELTRGSVRAALTLAHANRFILPGYVSLYNFLLPNFFGNPATSVDYVARGNFWEPCCYAGLFAFALAVGAAALLGRQSAEARFWTVAALIGVWLSMGRDAGLFAVAFRVLPGVAKFHDPARWLQIATFALACLSAHGLDSLLTTFVARPRVRYCLAFALLALNTLDLFAFTRTLNPTAPADLTPAQPAYGARPRVYYADERLLWGRFISYRTNTVIADGEARRFALSKGPNIGTQDGLILVNGYEPVQSAVVAERLRKIDRATGAARDALLRRAGAAAVVTLDRRTTTPRVRALAAPTGRAWLGTTPLPVVDLSPDAVQIHHYDTGEAGTLTLSDSDSPGWTADVDGHPVPTPASAEGFRTLQIRREDRQATFRYSPTVYRLGLFLTLFVSGILIATAGSYVAVHTRQREMLPVSSRQSRRGGK